MEEEILTVPDTVTPVEEIVPTEEVPAVAEPTTVEVVDIQFRQGQKVYYFDPAGFACKHGDHVIIDTARGPEYGVCASANHQIPEKDIVAPLRSVIRMATAEDERIVAKNRADEKRAYEICMKKIAEHKLDMQLVSAEYAFDGSKILFFFTADERVDFRELVKNLASIFHTRIELRQIGVRDKAKMVGGLGICGRPFCCASFLDDFQPVSIKMAKTQNLSLNPTKISGTCGRLMCCLKYEQDAYEDLLRTSPKQDSFVDTPEGRGTVIEVDLLRQRVKVRMEDAPETANYFANEDIAVLRNGKAKKNDPPIPADLAPISGSGKRVHKEKNQEEPVQLEPIRFRYSTENVVDEPVKAPVQEESENKAPRPRRQNRKPRTDTPKVEQPKKEQSKKEQPKKEQPKKEQSPKQPKAEQPKKDAPKEDGEKQPRRRNNYRRYHKHKPQNEG